MILSKDSRPLVAGDTTDGPINLSLTGASRAVPSRVFGAPAYPARGLNTCYSSQPLFNP